MSDDSKNAPPLDPCGCCDGESAAAPAAIDNPPGLPAIRYRAGTHSSFKSTMLARLATAELAGDPFFGASAAPAPAPDLRTGDDFSAALIDAFAVTADVLTFYQERIANESYLRTATERRSVLELAREIGYELKPGVAAAAALKLVIEEPPKLPPNVVPPAATLAPPLRDVPVAAGTKVQSVPGPGEKPQTFETIEDVVAYPEWNEISVRVREPLYNPTTTLWSKGKIDVKKGEVIAVHAAGSVPAVVTSVVYDASEDTTTIGFSPDRIVPALAPPAILPLTLDQLTSAPHSLDDSFVQLSLIMTSWAASDLRMVARLQGWSLDEMASTMRRHGLDADRANTALSTFSVRAAPFGHNAPAYDYVQNPDAAARATVPFVPQPSEFNSRNLSSEPGAPPNVWLDGIYKDIAVGGQAILSRPKRSSTTESDPFRVLYDVTSVHEQPRSSLSINAKVTVVAVDSPSPPTTSALDDFQVRTTTVLAGSARFDAPEQPIPTPIHGTESFQLDGVYPRLAVGQKIAISGERSDAKGVFVSEVRALKEVRLEGAYTRIVLAEGLHFSYHRKSVVISANVASATHGETVEEVLGNGDAGIAYQSFTLKQKPLTYVGAAVPGGIASTLEVRVNDVLWKEVPTLFGRRADERIYVTRRDDDGTATVQFGDGNTGARVPTGQANVRAKYRKGIGLEGLVGADKITLLLSRPLGLKGATNPLPSADASDPEPRDEARSNAPLTVLTLDRVVSLRDYEDFARGYTGVAKSLATWMQGKERRGVFVTVAGPNGNPIANTAAIEEAMHSFGNRFVPVRVRSFRQVFFRLAGSVTVAPDRLPKVVKAAIESKLRNEYSFANRAFGQPVFRSEVVALIQGVDGVVSVKLTTLRTDAQTASPLVAAVPEGELAAATQGAELLVLDPRPVDLVVTK